MYKKVFHQRIKGNKYLIHLWDDQGYKKLEWTYPAFIECPKNEHKFRGLNGEYLKKTYKWWHESPNIHFHDMPPHQRFLIDKYGTNDKPSTTHRELFFDIETEMGDALTPEYIKSAPKKVTSIAWWDKQVDMWGIIILDPKGEISDYKDDETEIYSAKNEQELFWKFLERWREIDPDIVVNFNGDFFDIPYLYYRMCKVIGEQEANYLSPIGIVRETPWYYARGQFIQIAGVESLDYYRMHKKYSWEDEPDWSLNGIGLKYVNLGKIEYEGNLDKLFKDDIKKFIQYNFRDVEILKELDKKLNYINLTKNLSHKGKHNYSEVYANTKTQDGAISAYLLEKGIIPPSKDKDPISKDNYAGGYLFCPFAGIYKYVFDEDLTSLYPSIIMSLNIGKETLVGRILDADDRNNRLGLNDLKLRNEEEELLVENAEGKKTYVKVKDLIQIIEENNFSISANGVFFRQDKKSALYQVLSQWFDERVEYKNQMKKAYKAGNSEEGDAFYLLQYSFKILLNSLYGALAIPSFRYGNVLLAEATTLTGQRVICESALFVNVEMNKILKNEENKEKFKREINL